MIITTKRQLLKALDLLPDDAEIRIFEYRYNGGGNEEYWTNPVVFVHETLSEAIIVPAADAPPEIDRLSPLYGYLEATTIEDVTAPG